MKPTSNGKILVVDDNSDVLIAAEMLLERYGYEVELEPDPEAVVKRIGKSRYDLVLLDMNFSRDASSGREGFELMQQILEKSPSAQIVTMTAYGDVDLAVKAIKKGAIDFIEKPWQNERLLTIVANAIRLKRSKRKVEELRSKQDQLSKDIAQPYRKFIGESDAIRQVFEVIDKVADTEASVLIMGENGSGKELIAREIHQRSSRKNDVFIAVDLGSISETLFDSELFGHVKGAFTDAKHERKGRFEIASGGTLFLDEIGNLSLPLQQKLLTAIQNRLITRVGSNDAIPVDVRLICATNMPMHEMIDDHRFREDLYYRINTVEIMLPPLRQRHEDIPLLLNHFIEIFAKKYGKPITTVSDAALRQLLAYEWPGNIRELQHGMERAVIMCDSDVIGVHHLQLKSRKKKNNEVLSFDTYDLNSIEKKVIERVLRLHQGNVSSAAKDLGLTRTSLYRRMEKYEL